MTRCRNESGPRSACDDRRYFNQPAFAIECSMSEGTARLREMAEEQGGLFTRQQAESCGVAWSTISRLVTTGTGERVAHGVYRFRGGAVPQGLELHAAWLQLAPSIWGWERAPRQGVVSFRSAAVLYGVSELIPQRHTFTLPVRRQSRRLDVSLRQRDIETRDCRWVSSLLVTRPSRTAADLLTDHEDPGAVRRFVGESLRLGYESAEEVARCLVPHAHAFGFTERDGARFLRWLRVPEDSPPDLPLEAHQQPA